MNGGHDFTAVQMYWQPALIKLTQLPNPEHDGGKPTPCYVAAQQITLISRGLTSFSKTRNGHVTDPALREYFPAQEATFVVINSSVALQVLETPEQVALLRDRALGHKPELKPA